MKYCSAQHRGGWYCILSEGHLDDHLSLDNSKLWKGTPGAPVSWPLEKELTREQTDELGHELNPMLTSGEIAHQKAMAAQAANKPQFTGRSCPECGSLNTIQNGKCLLCMECKATGECG